MSSPRRPLIRLPSSAKLIWPEMCSEPAMFDGGDVGGDGRGRLRKGDAEFGEALVDAHAPAPSTAAAANQASRLTENPAQLWLTGISSIALMLRCGGRFASHQKRSARSSAVIGSMPA